MGNSLKILAIDTSTDETSAAVTEGTKILSNIIWSQASLHAKFGGVVPSLAQREHAKRIDWVVGQAVKKAKIKIENLDAVAVTAGPGLAIALGVGIEKAKRLAEKYKIPLIAVNHLEGHLLSPLAKPKTGKAQLPMSKLKFPFLGLVISGKNTLLVLVKKIGKYETLATTRDDALGEALDKAARMLGLGYPGGPVLEVMAKNGHSDAYSLPLPMAGQEDKGSFSYSGLKTAMYRLVEKSKGKNQNLTKKQIEDLAASFQSMAFKHLIRVSSKTINQLTNQPINHLLVGGGVSANVVLRKRLRKMGKELGLTVHFPYSQKVDTDNAAMIGIAAGFKVQRGEFVDPDKIDREASAKVDEKFSFEK